MLAQLEPEFPVYLESLLDGILLWEFNYW